MRFAYADPPYIGQAKKHYGNEATYAGEVDHAELIARLCREYDAWALSCSSTSLKRILALCPDDVRIASWVKPFAAFKKNVNPAYCWEPIIFHNTRRRTREQPTLRDWIAESITLRRGLCGVKPLKVCLWMFDFANLNGGDEFSDLYPGSGAVTAAWEIFRLSSALVQVPMTEMWAVEGAD